MKVSTDDVRGIVLEHDDRPVDGVCNKKGQRADDLSPVPDRGRPEAALLSRLREYLLEITHCARAEVVRDRPAQDALREIWRMNGTHRLRLF